MMRLINALFALICISGCSTLELPPHDSSDEIVNYTPAEPAGYENWAEGEKQEWLQLEEGLEESKNRYHNAVDELAQSTEKEFVRLAQDIEI